MLRRDRGKRRLIDHRVLHEPIGDRVQKRAVSGEQVFHDLILGREEASHQSFQVCGLGWRERVVVDAHERKVRTRATGLLHVRSEPPEGEAGAGVEHRVPEIGGGAVRHVQCTEDQLLGRPASEAHADVVAHFGVGLPGIVREQVLERCDDHPIGGGGWDDGCVFRNILASRIEDRQRGVPGLMVSGLPADLRRHRRVVVFLRETVEGKIDQVGELEGALLAGCEAAQPEHGQGLPTLGVEARAEQHPRLIERPGKRGRAQLDAHAIDELAPVRLHRRRGQPEEAIEEADTAERGRRVGHLVRDRREHHGVRRVEGLHPFGQPAVEVDEELAALFVLDVLRLDEAGIGLEVDEDRGCPMEGRHRRDVALAVLEQLDEREAGVGRHPSEGAGAGEEVRSDEDNRTPDQRPALRVGVCSGASVAQLARPLLQVSAAR